MTYPVRAVTVSAEISGQPDEVFEFIADTRNDPMWNANVGDVRQVAGDGVAVGSKFEFTQTIEMKKRTLVSDVTVEVVELGERSIRWAVEDKFQVRDITMLVEPSESGCAVTQTTMASFKGKPGLSRYVYPMLAKRTFRSQFENLKKQFA